MMLSALLLGASAFIATSVTAAPEVKLGGTTLVGRDVTGLKQDFFGGIPFAEPPVGQLRLKPPVLKTRLSSSTFDASNFGPACFQSGVPVTAMSEDCLTINVFRPSGIITNASLPVLFWTYGGGFIGGASSIYNGSAIVAQSVARGTPLIYVNFNYRLGPLGFPQGQEADDLKALNLALRDQLAALEWVHENIGLFGGDKTKVTAFGESAGAIMTSILFFNSPLPKLVRGVILESGSPASALTFPATRREVDWQNFVSGVPHCASTATSGHTFDCLRTANSSDILQGLLNSLAQSPEEFPFDPTLDGPGGLYPDLASRLFARGQFARIPSIAGTNLDEGTLFTSRAISTEGQVRDAIIANFSPPIVSTQTLASTADRLLQLYPDDPALGSPFGTGNETFGLSSVFKQTAALQGDLSFQSQRRSWSQVHSRAGVKTFGYLFTEPQPDLASSGLGVAHGSEVTFVYGRPNTITPTSTRLSSLMIEYWVSFATSLDPNDGRGLERPHWDQYTPDKEALMQLNGANLTLIPDDYRKEQIDFINSIPEVFHHRRRAV
ncbi:putative type-B carboxylesterase lipase family protein [Lyophyllum shimeji]|uniref:Type-B carboxylesterase lipase family protein n=1 Tax=Lyophyllum shimeji TaxID=47721 RepID=A0A9P3PQ91_LYOSH|nr:putative type-B carboxylesterase lipase family protein [Lyophyllum shimeji]